MASDNAFSSSLFVQLHKQSGNFLLFLFSVLECYVCMYMCILYVSQVSTEARKILRYSKTGIMEGCETSCGSWEPNLGPFRELPVLLITEMSLISDSYICLQFPLLHMVISTQVLDCNPPKCFMYTLCNCILSFGDIKIILNLNILFFYSSLIQLIVTI